MRSYLGRAGGSDPEHWIQCNWNAAFWYAAFFYVQGVILSDPDRGGQLGIGDGRAAAPGRVWADLCQSGGGFAHGRYVPGS